ncbi:MAG TPA: NAD-binding protein [Micromonosporaceae bacterium]|nr:NAD-binding protein [Micromonosporaceae bacterium]
MKAMIAGAGRLGTQIAEVLAGSGYELTLVERDDDRAAELAARSSGRLVPGDACEPAVLEEAGVRTADLVVATTGEDEDNLVISLLAKRQFAVPRVAARINDPDNSWLFDEQWGVDIAVPAAAPLISLIEEASGVNDTVSLLRLGKADVTLIETVITARSRTVGHGVDDIPLPAGTIVAAVVRRGTPLAPEAAQRLQAGDELLVVSSTADENDIHAVFQ